jgi:hypothetical protein|tara:strand:+ start:10699 stop:16293 length:5595 start_codon:yes stop_codon:yes gene_type:complete
MKKGKLTILLLSLLFLSSGAKATHIMGGEITWQCLKSGGNQGDYIFTMKIYFDCFSTVVLPNNTQISVWGSTTINNFNLNLISNTDISPNGNAANSGTACLDCAAGNAGAVEEYIYTSAPITLLGIPPINGWHFTWDSCCRNIAVSNIQNPTGSGFTLRASMFPFTDNSGIILPADPCFDSSPVFSENPQTIICTGYPFTYSHNASDPEFDSLSYQWDAPLNAFIGNYIPPINPQAINFSAPYTFDSPLPGAPNLSPTNGEISFSPNIAGNFVSLVRVDAWKCGQRVASIYRENQIVLVGNCPTISGGGINLPPVITVPTNSPQSWTTTTNLAGLPSYETTVNAGELVGFNISAQDLDLYNGGASQVVTLEISGGQIAPCNNPPCASFVNASGGGLPPFTSPTLVEGVFEWTTPCVNSSVCGVASNQFTFLIKAYDDFCPANAITISTITINVNPSAGYDSLYFSNLPTFCDDGDTTDLTTYLNNLLGTPVIFSSNTGAITSSGIFTSNAGNHIITVMTLNGACSDTLTDTINIPTFTVGLSGLPLYPCEDPNGWLNLDNYATVLWGGTAITPLPSILYSCSTSGIVTPGGGFYLHTPGTYTINMTTAYNGCWASNSITITVYMSPIVNIIGDSNICVGDTATLTANSSLTWGVTYNWSNGANTPTITVIPTTTTSYSVTVTSLYGCVGTDTFTVNVNPAPNFNINYGDVYCDGDSIVIMPSYIDSNCHTFSWVDLDWNIISTDSFVVVKPGTYTLTVTDTITGCTSDTTINTDDFMPSVSIQGQTIACQGDTVMLWDTLTNNYIYQWSTGSTDTAIYVTQDGWYTLTVTDTITGCNSIDSINVFFDSIQPYIIFTESIVDTICEGDTVMLSVLDSLTVSQYPPSNYTINWSNGANTNTTNVSGGIHWVTVTNPNGCTTSDTITIVQISKPNLSITSSISSAGCEDSVLVIASTTPFSSTATYKWWDEYATVNNITPSPIHFDDDIWVYQTGPLIVTVSDSGCSTKDTIHIEFNDACCKVPNADIEIEVDDDLTLIALAGNNNPIQNKIIVIHDTLFIRKGLILEDCEVFMGANAVIWYDASSSTSPSLILDNTHIHACSDTMWQGIYVNSRNIIVKNGSIIEDAIEAIVINLPGVTYSNDAYFRITDSYLRNNLFSLVAYPDLEINNSYFVGNTISNDKKLLYNQYNGVNVDSSFVGILLNKTRPIVIGDGSTSAYKNTIKDLKYGIVGLETDFEVYNNHFENIYEYHSTGSNPLYSSSIVETACIFGLGDATSIGNTMKVGDTNIGNSNSFLDFHNGIFAARINSFIKNNSFIQGRWRGVMTFVTADRTTIINNNQFVNVQTGVWAGLNENGHYDIDYNEFSTDPSLGNITSNNGVLGENWNSNTPNIFMVTNNCFTDVLFHGVKLRKVRGSFIHNNHIDNSNFGIDLKHCNFARVGLNNLIGNYNQLATGITVSYSTAPRLQCNSIKYFEEALHFDGQMNAQLRNNTMVHSLRGVVIDYNGSIGQQGTQTDPWDNRWIGGFGQANNRPHLFTKSGSVGITSQFFTRTGYTFDPTFSDNLSPATVIPVPNYISNNPPVNWCAALPNCNDNGGGPSDDDNDFGSALANPNLNLLESIALSDTAFILDPSLFNSQELLYKELKDSTALTDSSIVLANFKAAKVDEDMGRMERIRMKIADSLFTDAQAITDSMLALYPYEMNAKTVYDKILAPYLRGEDITKLTASELFTIKTIAYLCPHTDGLIVYTARVIASLFDKYYIDYVNVCERNFALVAQPRLAEDEVEGLSIYPNPANTIVYLQANLENTDYATIQLVNTLGQITGTYTLNNNEELQIDVSELASGIYVCKLVAINGKIIATEKLTIE